MTGQICSVCKRPFQRDDAVESLGGRLIHTRCLPRASRSVETERDRAPDDEDDDQVPV